jgi:hypothetical protein
MRAVKTGPHGPKVMTLAAHKIRGDLMVEEDRDQIADEVKLTIAHLPPYSHVFFSSEPSLS